MSTTPQRLGRMLRDARGVDEWVLRERVTTRVTRTLGKGRALRGESDERELRALVLSDGEGGRGAAMFDVAGDDDDVAAGLVARAAEDAALGRGPSWNLPPAAAPARVIVADPSILGDPRSLVDALAAQVMQVGGRSLEIAGARVAAEVTTVRVETSKGFGSEYEATAIEIEMWIAGGAGGAGARAVLEPVRLRERRLLDVAVAPAVAAAAARLDARAQAAPLESGPCDLVLAPAALAAGRWGWFAPLVAQADARRVRLGVSRYRPGQAVFARRPGGAARADATRLTLSSDGTIPFAPLSAPFGDLGEPVRRFDLVHDGIASGLALDLREGGLAGATANGGVRNLVLAAGTNGAQELAEPGERPLVAVSELAWMDTDDQSGDFSAGISLGTRRTGDGAGAPVAGGVLVGNLFRMLARARLSAETGASGWYRGPSVVRIDQVLVQ